MTGPWAHYLGESAFGLGYMDYWAALAVVVWARVFWVIGVSGVG